MKKKIIIPIIIILIVLGIGGGVYYYLNKPDKNTLTILEKQWIDSNKNNVIDISIENDIPIFSYDGEGLIYEFFDDLEKTTELSFNRLAYDNDENMAYTIKMTDEIDNNDIVIYEDNYALITKKEVKYNSISSIKDIKIGVLESEAEDISYYLSDADVSYVKYEKEEDLIKAIDDDEVDGIVVSKVLNLDTILEKKLTIAYNITEMTKKLVFTLGDNNKLNSIIKKYFAKWKEEEFTESLNTNLSSSYYTFNDVSDDEQVNFKSRRYKYGFVSNIPYDKLIDHHLIGINSELIKDFSKLSGVEVTYNEYKSYAKLIKDFNENKIDFFFNQTDVSKYDMDVDIIPSVKDDEVIILSSLENDIVINSINSLRDNEVMAVDMTKIAKYLEDNKISVKKFDNIDALLSKINNKSIIVIDESTYEMYKNSKLKDYEIDYTYKFNSSYNYVLRDISDNELFNNYFGFYLSFANTKSIINRVDYRSFETATKLAFIRPVLYTLFAIIGLIIIAIIIRKIKNRKPDKSGVAKEDKLKYIDMLTSLKNRNYLNDSIERWDESEVYPQTIIIIDLNNVAYINDNYGHNEGDEVIKEAANILIKNQQEQSEIIRTNGNEFLIYLVGYEEKQIITYIRKLSKEFKELEHGFGAAIGYSIITDAIKTVDDAINEATLDMKTNKEETQD